MSAYEPTPTRAATAESAAPPPSAQLAALLASRWRRFFALLIDWVLLMLVAFLAGVSTSIWLDGVEIGNTAWTIVSLLVWPVLTLLYAPPLISRKGTHNGQTLGKQLLRVRVVTKEGVPITLKRALKREFLGVTLPNAVLRIYWPVDCGWALVDKRRQALHDKIGSTYVVKHDVPLALVRQLHDAEPLPSWMTAEPVYPVAQPVAPPYRPAPMPQPWTPPPTTAPEAPSQTWAPPASGETPRETWQPPAAPAREAAIDDARRAFGDDSFGADARRPFGA